MNIQLIQETILEMLHEYVRIPKQRISLTAEELERRLGFDPINLSAYVDSGVKEKVSLMYLCYSQSQSTPHELVFMDLTPSIRRYANGMDIIVYMYDDDNHTFEEYVIFQNGDNVEL